MKLRMISVKDLEKYIDREDILLVDLREYEEYQKDHITGAVWADWESLDETIDSLLDTKGEKISWTILYCRRGNTSLLSARDLARMGYPVMSLNGGYERWKANES